jgi:hypothetical protein
MPFIISGDPYCGFGAWPLALKGKDSVRFITDMDGDGLVDLVLQIWSISPPHLLTALPRPFGMPT